MTNSITLTFALSLMTCSTMLGQTTTLFSDDFETPQTWTIFEEIVSGNACYGDNIGEVLRSTDFAQGGTNGLRVWSNKNGSTKSNHVIAAHTISTSAGLTGRARYGLWAYNATTIGLTQSSPEMSVQSTRTVGAANLTFIAGIQYIGNQWVADKWRIWHNGTWQNIATSEFGATLTSNTWYYLEMAFDMTTNTYISFKIQGGGLNETLNLTQPFINAPTGFQIGGEARSWTPSLFVTAESENLWTTCSEVRENKVYYDNVLLESIALLPIELLDFKGFANTTTNRLTWTFANAKELDKVEVQKSKDGTHFTPLSILSQKEGELLDETPFSSTYYRLKMTEIDGKTAFSKVIVVANKGTSRLTVYPNLVKDVLNVVTEEKGSFQVVNLLGQQVLKGPITPQIEASTLPTGTYMIKIGEHTTKFVKL